MWLYFWFWLIAHVLIYALQTYAEIRQMKKFNEKEVPAAIASKVKAEEFEKS
jgi:hypothetical protein